MLVSFLVPVYNTERYLKKCIDSLLVQKGASFEIVLLDDGSTDSCPEICDEYKAAYPNIIKVIHKENEGLLLTRRRGFREASGEWFICVDSDDYVAPDLLQSVVKTIEKHDDCDMVMFNYYYVDDQGTVSPSRLQLKDGSVYRGESKQQLYAARLTTTSLNNMWLRAIRRDIVDIEADYSEMGIRNMCEDALQVLPLYTNTQKTVYVDKPLYYYRKANGSITSNTTLAHWQAIHRSFVLEQPYAELWQVAEDVRCKRYTKQLENICNCVRWLYGNGRKSIGMSVPNAVIAMKNESLFNTCLENYDGKYASTRYSRISTPIIASAVKNDRFDFLECFFRLENRLLRKCVQII